MADADYFDRWYADIERSPVRQAVFTSYLGLPAEVGPSNDARGGGANAADVRPIPPGAGYRSRAALNSRTASSWSTIGAG